MSHISKIDLIITDLNCLKKACETLQFQFVEGAQDYRWFGSQNEKCAHKIVIPGSEYEVGIVQDAKGYTLQYDAYTYGGLFGKIGTDAGPIKQQYTKEVIKKAAYKKNYAVSETVEQDGTIKMTVRVK